MLWDDPGISDEYLTDDITVEMVQEDREIVQSWKRCVQGRFILERHLKKGTIFVSMDAKEVSISHCK